MVRFIIAPDPATPGAYYAEEIESHRRFRVPGPRMTRKELRKIVDPYHQLPLPRPTMEDVEHPTPPEQQVHAVNDDGDPLCLEPGCLTPAPLYCKEHRHQMYDHDF